MLATADGPARRSVAGLVPPLRSETGFAKPLQESFFTVLGEQRAVGAKAPFPSMLWLGRRHAAGRGRGRSGWSMGDPEHD